VNHVLFLTGAVIPDTFGLRVDVNTISEFVEDSNVCLILHVILDFPALNIVNASGTSTLNSFPRRIRTGPSSFHGPNVHRSWPWTRSRMYADSKTFFASLNGILAQNVRVIMYIHILEKMFLRFLHFFRAYSIDLCHRHREIQLCIKT